MVLSKAKGGRRKVWETVRKQWPTEGLFKGRVDDRRDKTETGDVFLFTFPFPLHFPSFH
jgi:hypothetical protein